MILCVGFHWTWSRKFESESGWLGLKNVLGPGGGAPWKGYPPT